MSPSDIPEPPLVQVSFSIADLPATLRFCSEALGYRSMGGQYLSGPEIGRLQQLQDPACMIWMIARQPEFFHLEFFQYTFPPPLPRPRDWRPCDTGYSLVTLE